MSKYKDTFTRAMNAPPINNFAPSIGLGKHRVGLKVFRCKNSTKTKQLFVEADVMILESTMEEVGATRSWAWFINAPGEFTGQYAQARLTEFLKTVGDSIESDQSIDEIGDALVDEDTNNARGIELDVEVTAVPDKNDPSKVMKRKGGQPVHNAVWYAVKQGKEDIEASKKKMDELAAAAPKTKSASATASVQSQTQSEQLETGSASAQTVGASSTGGIKKLLLGK